MTNQRIMPHGPILSLVLMLLLPTIPGLINPHATSTRDLSSIDKAMSSMTDASIGPINIRSFVQDASRFAQQADDGLDLRGIIWLEHLNLVVGCMETAKKFYVDFLGLTVDSGNPKHFNLGQQQFHLAATDDPPQRITGSICLTLPSLKNVRDRAQVARHELRDTLFSICEENGKYHNDDNELMDKMMTVTCPWGNTFHLFDISIDETFTPINARTAGLSPSPHKMVSLHLDGATYGPHRMAVRSMPGIRAVEMACRKGTSSDIARFYETFLGCTVMKRTMDDALGTEAAAVRVGPGVHFVFVENESVTENDLKEMEGVHVCVYVADFKKKYSSLQRNGLIWTNPRFTHLDSCDSWEEALASRTFRFKDILDETGAKIFELEHETRPMMHGQYMKVPTYKPN